MTNGEAPADTGDEVSRETWFAIGAMLMAVFAVANDFTAMNVVLPTIESDMNTDLATVQWVVNGYALMFGVLIVPGGRLADLYGRKEMLAVGALIFASFSLLGGLAPNIFLLILARILMGIGAAMMWPAILGLIYSILPESKAGLAGGLVIGVAGIGNATGPVIAGALAEESWRYIFFLNVPIAIGAVAATWILVPSDKERQESKLDLPGSALLTISLLALLSALTVAPNYGYTSALVLGAFAVGVVAMVLFVLRERAVGEDGLIPRSLIGNASLRWACFAILSMSTIFFAALFYLPQYFQKILDEGTLAAGIMLLPFVATFAMGSFAETWLVNRVGMKAVITVGAVFMFAGAMLLALMVDQTSTYASLLPGMIALGLGVGFFYSTITTAALTSVDPSRSSLAGGLLYMFQIAGGSIGLAITTTIFLATSSSEVDRASQELGLSLSSSELLDAQGVLVGTETSQQLTAGDPSQATQLIEIVADAFVTGMRWAFSFGVLMSLIGMAITVAFVAGPISRFGRDIPDRNEDSDAESASNGQSEQMLDRPVDHSHPHRHRHAPS
ncbi:MAG: MFS transporter [Ilumatobacteraceae bacterium]|nr:MFS transporter [Ilumatobacteraceae bacterium]